MIPLSTEYAIREGHNGRTVSIVMCYWLLIIIVLTYLLIASYVGIYGGVLW